MQAGAKEHGSSLEMQETCIRRRSKVVHTVIRAKLVYGLETCRIDQRIRQQLGTFQIQGMRAISGLKHVYYSRTMTNARVNDIARRPSGLELEPLSRWVARRTSTLWAHIVRAEKGDPIRKVTINEETGERLGCEKRGVGKPRITWFEAAAREAWDGLDAVMKGH